jgi:hypothetical protein
MAYKAITQMGDIYLFRPLENPACAEPVATAEAVVALMH